MMKADVDVLIIGGGIFGCGIAQAVSVCGYQTKLIEQHHIASGTSSQSTKLIHGGLRYLEQMNFKLVYEALHEREMLLKNAPDLVSREWFYIPIYKDGKRPACLVALGLGLYYILSGGRSRFKKVSKEDWAHVLPALNTKDLNAVLAYEDAATDDAALTRAVAASAADLGCDICENTAVQSATYQGECWQVQLSTGETITTKVLINAAGAWVNRVHDLLSPQAPQIAEGLEVQLVQGSHLLLNRPCSTFVYTESLDGRVMFFRPWKGKTLAGTTEKIFTGNPSEVKASADEIEGILNTYNHYFPDMACHQSDITKVYCGLRVLPLEKGGAFGASRETVIYCDSQTQPSYIAVYGGKLTTYRSESEKVMRLVLKTLKTKPFLSTKNIRLTPCIKG